MEGLFDYSIWGLFLASFLAAAVVPFCSEALLTYHIFNGIDPYSVVLVACRHLPIGRGSYGIDYLGMSG